MSGAARLWRGPGAGAADADGSEGEGPRGVRRRRRRHRVAMVSDFFYPHVGGVETHIWSLSQHLLRRGHKVVVVTHAYGERKGVRYMSNGLKVYYVPLPTFWRQGTLVTFVAWFPVFRDIIIRERIDIVHAHGLPSNMAGEGMLFARAMGLRVVYTDHSLFPFGDVASIHANALVKWTLSDVDCVIAVSNECRRNLAARARLHPRLISVIPNAVDATAFVPAAERPSREGGGAVIVVISRLTRRKGADLLAAVVPEVCRRVPGVRFIIGGDGPKRAVLDAMREGHALQGRVELLGAVDPSEVAGVLRRGHVFLNCSLTESFGIAILEAACCGLLVVSTRVGGVPEVLPEDMALLAEPDTGSVAGAVEAAIGRLGGVDPLAFHRRVRGMYSWGDVADRTAKVYDAAVDGPQPDLGDRFLRYFRASSLLGWAVCLIAGFLQLELGLMEWLRPASRIRAAPDLPRRRIP